MLNEANTYRCRDLKTEDLGGLHIVPALWSPAMDPTIFPYPEKYHWVALEMTCRELDVKKAVVCTSPQTWQLEPLVYRTTNTIGVPVISTPPQNLPVLKPFSEQVGVDLIITSTASASRIIEILETVTAKPKAMIVIHSDAGTLPRNGSHDRTRFRILHELHLVPGLPLLYQEAGQSTDTDFKRNELFSWTETGEATFRVSLPEDWPVRVVDMPLPFRLLARSSNDLFSIL